MAMTTNDTHDLLSLLPNTSYTLAYALPLFIVSIILTFAGCFLTLDRTRTFPSSVQAQAPPTKKPSLLSRLQPLYLGGGIGGCCGGYAFGGAHHGVWHGAWLLTNKTIVHFATFLSILLPNTTSTSPLGHKVFLAIWALSALVCLALGGKWKYAAISLIGVSGYCALALAISVIVHPSLLTRIVLAGVFTPLGTILCLLPFPRGARIALRVGASSLGAFGVTETVAIFSHNPAWGNVWDRFWMHDGLAWGTGVEKGLSAAFCFFFVAGLACDWFLHAKIGENPDEKWDRYLADYATELPNDSRRAGTFAPIVSFWDRFLGTHGPFAPVVQHNDIAVLHGSDVKLPIATNPTNPGKLAKQRSLYRPESFSDIPDSKLHTALLRKKDARHGQRTKAARRTIKFTSHNQDSSSDSEDEGSAEKIPLPSRTDSSTTLVDSRDHSLQPPKRAWEVAPGEVPDYSDGEGDIGKTARLVHIDEKAAWPPEFIRRHSRRTPSPVVRPFLASHKVSLPADARDGSQEHAPTHSISSTAIHPSTSAIDITSIPATASLIKAVERVQLAHGAMAHPSPATTPSSRTVIPTSQLDHERKKSWDAFWDEVKEKAHY
ncbi:hypothetical protein BC835DRAFT_1413230 [Cytidiella melzeri]|nr:hypothetical protein BC835DRAFT_1413230 [Cytidiella melzeri]